MLLVVVATARCRVPTAQHSTHFHFLTFPLPGGGWCGLTRPAPARAPQRCTWRTLAQGSAPARSAEQPRRSVPAPPHYPVYPATHWHHTHTHNFHYLLTFIGRGARWEHSGWFCSLLGAVDGSISRIRSIRNMQPTFGEGDLKWSELYLL